MKHILLVSLFVTSVSHANLNGRWIGGGETLDSSGEVVPCELVVIDLTTTETQLVLNEYYSICDARTIGWDKTIFSHENGSLFLDGETVGSIEKDHIRIEFNDPDVKQIYDIRLKNGGVDFLDRSESKNRYNQTSGFLLRKK